MIEWRKSSRSGGVNDNACVELARLDGAIGVRDSKDPAGGHLGLSSREFSQLVTRIKHGALALRAGD
ncbi:DUF397 domain-containing protein [Actinomadura sp. NAK00032]|uniref:DUF397 domain-containing protein n=1 Tax=Actinomadura sp. NAK00032 TaxID=2742128 RepID=UPI001590259F|nr:DUF397 domain-containing protein [Actinomadura sp. NAK00032]QKW37654.1 DUF397 domain-containing protein [Actinomadura sp. NAK00032]